MWRKAAKRNGASSLIRTPGRPNLFVTGRAIASQQELEYKPCAKRHCFFISRLICSTHPERPEEGLVHSGCSITKKSGGRNPSQMRVEGLLPCPFLKEEIQRDGGIFPRLRLGTHPSRPLGGDCFSPGHPLIFQEPGDLSGSSPRPAWGVYERQLLKGGEACTATCLQGGGPMLGEKPGGGNFLIRKTGDLPVIPTSHIRGPLPAIPQCVTSFLCCPQMRQGCILL